MQIFYLWPSMKVIQVMKNGRHISFILYLEHHPSPILQYSHLTIRDDAPKCSLMRVLNMRPIWPNKYWQYEGIAIPKKMTSGFALPRWGDYISKKLTSGFAIPWWGYGKAKWLMMMFYNTWMRVLHCVSRHQCNFFDVWWGYSVCFWGKFC